MISSVAYLLELLIHTLLLRTVDSNRIVLTLDQQVDVLEELVRDNRVEVNFTLATHRALFKDSLNTDLYVQCSGYIVNILYCVLHIHSGIRFELIRNIIRSNLRNDFSERY